MMKAAARTFAIVLGMLLPMAGAIQVDRRPDAQVFSVGRANGSNQVITDLADSLLPSWRRSNTLPDRDSLEQSIVGDYSNVKKPDCVKKVAFFHIPKTGGRTIGAAISASVMNVMGIPVEEACGLSRSTDDVNDSYQFVMQSREGELRPYFLEFHTLEAKAGQIMPTLEAMKAEEGCGLITATLLREPVSRTSSSLNYDLQTGCLPPTSREHATQLFGLTSDQQSRFLAADKYCPICGEFWNNDDLATNPRCAPLTQDEQEANQALLESMDAIGTMENMDAFFIDVLQKMGFHDPGAITVRKGGESDVLTETVISELSETEIGSIKAAGKYDDELYQYALQRGRGGKGGRKN